MRTDRLTVPICAWILCAGLASAGQGEQQDASASSWDRYKVMGERNIFLRERSRPRPKTEASPAPVRIVERSVVLTGVVRQGETYIAFLEDTRTGETSRLRAGGVVAEGRIVEIDFDGLVFEKDKKAARIGIGNSLDGASSSSSREVGSSGAATGAVPSSPGLTASDERAILERLRQRREKELKKP